MSTFEIAFVYLMGLAVGLLCEPTRKIVEAQWRRHKAKRMKPKDKWFVAIENGSRKVSAFSNDTIDDLVKLIGKQLDIGSYIDVVIAPSVTSFKSHEGIVRDKQAQFVRIVRKTEANIEWWVKDNKEEAHLVN